MKKLLYATTALALLSLASPATAQKFIYTGGVKGAYFNTFCPPLEPVLHNAMFTGYKCTPSNGTLENIQKVMAQPTNIGFVQLDVLAREMQNNPDMKDKIMIVRQLACEGVWLVTKNPRIKDYGDVLGLARRLPFVLPPEQSGSSATFAYLKSIDPDGLGRARNVRYMNDATAVLTNVAASSDGSVGMFVQFADPENANIRLMHEKGLTVIPVVSREMMAAKANGTEVYQVQTFSLVSGYFSGQKATTACTPVALITGNPTAFKDENDKKDQVDMIKELQTVPEAKLMPQESRIASLMKAAQRISGKALDEMMGAVEAAKKKAEQLGQ